MFAVRTPTAVITDLGTEFAVEVDRRGEAGVVVFKGEVVASALGGVGPVRLKAGESARIDAQRHIFVEKSSVAGTGRRFIRAMSQWPHRATIANASFENPQIRPDDAPYLSGIFDWQCDRTEDWGINRYGDEFLDPVPDGRQLGFINAGEMWQVLAERLAPNTKYTLTLWVGNRGNIRNKSPLNPDYTVELAAGDTTLIAEKNPVMPAKGRFAKATLTYTTGDDHPALGQRLKIILRSNVNKATTDVQNHFDHIQLEVAPMD